MTPDLANAAMNIALLWMLTTPHEFAHAWVATRLGDDTPLKDGRVTLNPLAHLDWLGTVILPAVTSLLSGGFMGWGKSVMTNPARLAGGLNGLALVALAGPISNVIFAVVLGGVAALSAAAAPALAEFAARGVWLSLYLAIFNMLPVPPLDGSKLLLAARVPVAVYNELARFGFMLLMLAVAFSDVGRWMSMWSWQGTRVIFGLFHQIM
ncbi:MAG TPA: site-2 protease family protein [Bryobacteraceae bacterium]|nr:site-2 protease family protein [Bryobacteraceae bacterium]